MSNNESFSIDFIPTSAFLSFLSYPIYLYEECLHDDVSLIKGYIMKSVMRSV